MSSAVSREELEVMDRDQLVDLILDFDRRLEDLEERVTEDFDTAAKDRAKMRSRVDEVLEENERLRAENQQLKDRLDNIEATADQAMNVASRGHNPDERSKTEVAKHITRNTLVARAARGGAAKDRKLTISEVQDKAEPEHDLAWAIVDRAWSQLREEWPQFRDTTKDGAKAMSISRSDVTKGLVRAVEHDLGRDDLAKQFVGDSGEGGE